MQFKKKIMIGASLNFCQLNILRLVATILLRKDTKESATKQQRIQCVDFK